MICLPAYGLDFSATTDNGIIEVCRGGSYTDSITIFNSNNEPVLFTLAPSGKAEPWSTIAQSSILIAPYSTESVENFLNVPSSAEGRYRLDVQITANNDVKKVIEQTVNVKSCKNIIAGVKEASFSNCPCQPTQYVFTIKNSGEFADILELSVDIPQEYYALSEEMLTIPAGETREVYLYVTMPCDVYGDFWLDLKGVSIKTGQSVTVPVFLNLRQECYDFSLTLGKAVQLGTLTYGNQTVKITFNESKTDQYTFCMEEDYAIPVVIKNKGEIFNTFLFRLKPKDTLTDLFSEQLLIGKNASEYNYIFINSGGHKEGSFPFNLTVETEKGSLAKTYGIYAYVKDCMNRTATGNETQTPPVTAGNDKMKTFLLWLLLILLILFLLFGIIYLFRESEEKTDQEKEIERKKKEKEEELARLQQEKEDELARKQEEKEEELERKEKEKEEELERKRKEKEEAERERQERRIAVERQRAEKRLQIEKEREERIRFKEELQAERARNLLPKRKFPWKILLIIIVILLVLLTFYFAWRLWPAIKPAAPIENITQIKNATVNITTPVVNLSNMTITNVTVPRWARWFNFPAIWKGISTPSKPTMTTVPDKAKQNITIEAVNESQGFFSKFLDLFARENINVSKGNVSANITKQSPSFFSKFIDIFSWRKPEPVANETKPAITNPIIDLDKTGIGTAAYRNPGDSSTFIVNGLSHKLTILSIVDESVIFEIRSDVWTLKADIGERFEIDSDSDGMPDTIITYQGIINGSKVLLFEKKGYEKPIPANATITNATAVNVTKSEASGNETLMPRENAISKAYKFIVLYIWYIIIALIPMTLIILLLSYLNSTKAKRKERRDQKEKERLVALLEKKKREKEEMMALKEEARRKKAEARAAAKLARKLTKREKKQKTFTQFLAVLFIVLLLLLVVLFVYTGTLKSLGIYVNKGYNQTVSEVNGTMMIDETIGPVKDLPLKENSTTYVWNKNTAKTVDLNKIVVDKDNDKLRFRSTPVSNISVSIKDGIVTMVPENDWYGIRYINFIVDDGHGGRAYSPDIMLVVNNKGAWYAEYWNNLSSFFSVYIAHMVLAMLLIIIGATIFVMKMQEHKSRKELEDNSRRK